MFKEKTVFSFVQGRSALFTKPISHDVSQNTALVPALRPDAVPGRVADRADQRGHQHARAHHAQKRGGSANKLSLEEAINYFPQKEMTLVALDDSLQELEKLDPRQSKIVELRFFGGLTTDEVSEVMGISTATIEREWRAARAWLHTQLSDLKDKKDSAGA